MSNILLKINLSLKGIHFDRKNLLLRLTSKTRFMLLRNLILTATLMLSVALGVQAQKFGYLNSQQLLLELPAIKQADVELQAYQNDMVSKGEQMVKTFEDKLRAVEEQYNKGELSQIQVQQKQGELGKEQQAIQQYQVEVNQKLGVKRQELYKPILDNVNKIIEQIGQEMGYSMIFDTSSGGLLFVEDSEDVTSIVKQKLGL